MQPRLFLASILLLFLPACGSPQAGQPTPMLVTVTLPNEPTLTQTPFLPAGAATQSFPALETPFPSTETPSPADLFPRPNDQVSILLLGSDQRPGRSDFRTDVFVLMTVRSDHTISLVSFPRDLYVYLPGQRMERINTAYEFGGFNLVSATLEYNFGLHPDHFVLVNFDGFRSIVDSLEGVDVEVSQALSDSRSGFPAGFTVQPGVTHMDGETALWYVRARMTTSDFDRLRRAQELLVAIGQKLFSLQGLAHVPEFYQAYQSTVVTDLTLEVLLGLLPPLQAVDPARVERYAIAPPLVSAWISPDTGAYLLLPDMAAIHQVLKQAMGISP
jgi:LCP family protein required for cell wall assembly